MSSVIDLLKSHRSIRKFSDQAIAPELFDDLMRAGQSAATSSFLQGATIVPNLRQNSWCFARISNVRETIVTNMVKPSMVILLNISLLPPST